MDDIWFTKDQILNIKEKNLPLLVLSYNYRSFISTGITHKTAGAYNHLMWMHRPGFFASQSWWFKEVPAEKYLRHHRLKFWTKADWKPLDKHLIKLKIDLELDKKPWKTRYDLLAILGQAIGITGIQVPWTKICSDHAEYLKIVDDRYNLVRPAPADVNRWLIKTSGYKVFARFIND